MDETLFTELMEKFNNSIWKKRILWILGTVNLVAITVTIVFTPIHERERDFYRTEAFIGWDLINTQNSDIVEDFVTSIAFDQEGRAWIGTNDGISVFDGESWVSYTTENSPLELTDASVNTIEVDSDGRIWIGLARGMNGTIGGLMIVDGENWEAYPSGIPPYRGSVHAIAFDENDQAWIGTSSGLHIFNGVSWRNISQNSAGSGLIDDAIRAIEFDDSGGVWIGTMEGLNYYDGKTWRSFTELNSDIPKNFISCIEVDQNGNTWIGWRGGASVFDGESWSNYHWEHSYQEVERDYPDHVEGITTDSHGRVLFISESALRIYDGNLWKEYNSENSGFPQVTALYDIAIDPQENIWISTSIGILVVTVDSSGLPRDMTQYMPPNKISPARYLAWPYLLAPIFLFSLMWVGFFLDDIVLIGASLIALAILTKNIENHPYYGFIINLPFTILLPAIGGIAGGIIRKLKKKPGLKPTSIGIGLGFLANWLAYFLLALMSGAM